MLALLTLRLWPGSLDRQPMLGPLLLLLLLGPRQAHGSGGRHVRPHKTTRHAAACLALAPASLLLLLLLR